MPAVKRSLKVFLCHAHSDVAAVRALYTRLTKDGVDAWLDKEKLLPGQDWEYEIRKAVREADVVVVCLSKQFNQAGFRQKEVRLALDTAMEQPEGEIFIIPARLEECENLENLRRWHWVDLFDPAGYKKLMLAFNEKANRIDATFKLQAQYSVATPSDKLFVKKIVETLEPRPIPWKNIAGIIGIVIALAWIGSWAMPKLSSFVPTATTTLTSQTTPASQTVEPIQRATEIFLITITPIIFNDPHPDPSDYIDALGVPMRLVPEGEFAMGSDEGEGDERPVHLIYLDAYYIDKYEVTNALYKACVDTGVCQSPQDTSSVYGFYGNSDYDNYPVMFIGWNMAKTYCEWRDAQLPTEAQWEKAAHGRDGRTYPWGEGIDQTFANYGQSGGIPSAVGSYESGKSSYGVYDLAGNLSEWIDDWYSNTFYANSPTYNPSGPGTGQYRVHRGGTWYDGENKVRASDRSSYDPDAKILSSFGFRCAKDANP